MDTDLAILVRAISPLRRTLAEYPEMLPILQKSWALRKQPRHLHSKLPGPIGMLTDELNRIGWQWPDLLTLRRPQGPDLHLLDTDLKYLQHQLREACRTKHYEDVVVERASYDGIERGVDKEASTYHIKQEKDPMDWPA